MHVVCVNYAYDRELTGTGALIERYETLAGWAEAIAAAGARSCVVQRFGADTEMMRSGVLYRFVSDPAWKHGSILDSPHRMHKAIAGLHPDVVHVNGLQFGRQARQLKRSLGSIPVLLQDHANLPPRHWLNRWTLQRALRQIDAVSFVSRAQARPWLEGGFLRSDQPVAELMEGSSGFCLKSRSETRARSSLSGSPICLWVGRLNANKDPITILRGFHKALSDMPEARLVMVYGTTDLLASVHQWLKEHPPAAERVTMRGYQPHAALEDIYNSADLFLSGSHHEGSGFAVLEALACGVVPVVTDIPSFRVLTADGRIGCLWQPDDPEGLARALKACYSNLHFGTPEAVRAFFDANFSWNAIGSRAVMVYRHLTEGKAGERQGPI